MEINISGYVSRYYAAQVTLSDANKGRTEEHRAMALAYVWGMQDGGSQDPLVFGDLADAFNWAYGTMHANFEAHRLTSMTPLRDAWASFKKDGVIRDYNGKPLSDFTPDPATASQP